MEDMNKFDEHTERHGLWKEERYYDGMMYWITNYEHGVKHGIEELQTEAGLVVQSQMYVNGNREGMLYFYHRTNGNLYSKGYIVKKEFFDKFGLWVYHNDNNELYSEEYYI